jgi:hypothetical protein
MPLQLAQTRKQPEHPVSERLLSRLLEDRATRFGDRVFLNFKGGTGTNLFSGCANAGVRARIRSRGSRLAA